MTGRALISTLIRGRKARQAFAAVALLCVPFLTMGADWPTYMGNAARTGTVGETILSTANASQITKLWSFHTGNIVGSTPSIVNNVVYVGSWDGYEYALNASTGTVIWKTYLGITSLTSGCAARQKGVESSAAIVNGTLYVGGGDANWYALNATTGQILWSVYVGDNSVNGGHFNWSSPLVANGHAYVGVASRGDCPLIQGQLLDINLSTHQIANTINIVPAGQVGGSIWSSPAGSFGLSNGAVFVTTGNEGTEPGSTQPLTRSVVAITTSTGSIYAHWQVPDSQAIVDSDFGATPTLFANSSGNPMIGVTNKNGYFYAFNRKNISAGPVWSRQIGGSAGTEVSPAAFAAGNLFIAGDAAVINGTTCSGNVRAVDPTTGNFLWQHCTTGPIYGGVAYANGLVIDTSYSTLEVLDASTGNLLSSFSPGVQIYGSPSVSNGRIFFGATNGYVYALGVPGTVSSTTGTHSASASSSGSAEYAQRFALLHNKSPRHSARLDQKQTQFSGGLSVSVPAVQTVRVGRSGLLSRVDLPFCTTIRGSTVVVTVSAGAARDAVTHRFTRSYADCGWYSFSLRRPIPVRPGQTLRLSVRALHGEAPLWASNATRRDAYRSGQGNWGGHPINDFGFRTYVS